LPAQNHNVAGPGRPPRLVLVIGSLDCGGAQRALADMANFWTRLDWDVTIATWSGSEIADFYAIDGRIGRVALSVRPAPARTPRFTALLHLLARMARLRRLVADKEPDAILSFIDVSNVLTILASTALGARVVVCERTDPSQNHTISRFWKCLRRLTYRSAGAVVAQTGDAARWLDRQCGVRSLVIPNAIRRMPDVAVSRTSTILALGRLTSEKGVDTVLRAFALISGKFPDWRVVIAGDGPERAALTNLRGQLGLNGRVEFVGQVRDVENWLAEAGLVVHASRREGFPNAVLEAMAMGAPVICTDCRSGPSDLIQDRINGRLIAVDDVTALAGAIAELIENPGLRVRLSSEAVKVRQSYEQTMIMERWNAVLLGRGAALQHG
jgi:GalNAc-alpha-(1->4)-GalNAc-alpha-(1->3)-diNAcBac-PP-undecaprenol alpha-1,4-N-acetyl-D-galactosaminyltransferase